MSPLEKLAAQGEFVQRKHGSRTERSKVVRGDRLACHRTLVDLILSVLANRGEPLSLVHGDRRESLPTDESEPLYHLDPEIEITLRRLRKARNIVVSNSSNSVSSSDDSSPVSNTSNFVKYSSTNNFAESEQMENNDRTLKELATSNVARRSPQAPEGIPCGQFHDEGTGDTERLHQNEGVSILPGWSCKRLVSVLFNTWEVITNVFPYGAIELKDEHTNNTFQVKFKCGGDTRGHNKSSVFEWVEKEKKRVSAQVSHPGQTDSLLDRSTLQSSSPIEVAQLSSPCRRPSLGANATPEKLAVQGEFAQGTRTETPKVIRGDRLACQRTLVDLILNFLANKVTKPPISCISVRDQVTLTFLRQSTLSRDRVGCVSAKTISDQFLPRATRHLAERCGPMLIYDVGQKEFTIPNYGAIQMTMNNTSLIFSNGQRYVTRGHLNRDNRLSLEGE
ncbi:hypothetical protein CR513_40359, partial [Mucuna pruriens]